MLISWSASGHGPVKDEEGASDIEEVTSTNDKEASVLPEDSASWVMMSQCPGKSLLR